MTALRPELLAGRTVSLVGDAPAVKTLLTKLGARVDTETSESADAIVYDAAPAFGDGGEAGSARGEGARLDRDQGGARPPR